MKETRHGFPTQYFLALVAGLLFVFAPAPLYAATVYDFNSDTLGSAPLNTTATGGTLQVVNDGTLGKSLRSNTQNGFISGLIFDQFASTTDYVVTWKQAYSSNAGAGGMILRASSSSMTYAGHTDARLGYLFQINGSTAYVWRTNVGGFTLLSSTSLTKASPQYYRAVVQGSNQGFYYSNDGSSYTLFASSTDSTYTSGLTQYTAGYGAGVGIDTIDDVTYTSLASDTTAPTVNTLTPADDSTATSTIATLRIKFSESVNVGTGNVTIKKAFDNSTIETIAVGSGQVIGGGTDTITITPNSTLEYGTPYYVQVPTTAFPDLAGNAFAGITTTTGWNFTTVSGGGGGLTSVVVPTAPQLSVTTQTKGVQLSFTTGNQGNTLSSIGFEYWRKGDEKVKITFPDAPQTLRQNIGGLVCNTTYNIQGYVSNQKGKTYSEPISFTTGECSRDKKAKASVVSEKIKLQATEQTSPVTVSPVRDLTLRMSGNDVKWLQSFLIEQNKGPAARALQKVTATSFFSIYTQKALSEYQKVMNIAPATGYFGPASRAALLKLGFTQPQP